MLQRPSSQKGQGVKPIIIVWKIRGGKDTYRE